MSQPLGERRSERNREPRRLYAQEQAYNRFQQQEDVERQRAIRDAEATVEPSDSDEEELPAADASSSDDDEKHHASDENSGLWSERLHDVHFPPCTVVPTVVLPPPSPSHSARLSAAVHRPRHDRHLRHQHESVRR